MKNTRWILGAATVLALLSGCVYRGRDDFGGGSNGWRDRGSSRDDGWRDHDGWRHDRGRDRYDGDRNHDWDGRGWH